MKPGFLTSLSWTPIAQPISLGLASVAVGCVVVGVAIALAFRFIPQIPTPAGPFSVGTFVWDADRHSNGLCPVSVQFWYPAEPGSGDGRAPYRPEGAAFFSAERRVRTDAKLNASVSLLRSRFPVLLSLPGWTGVRGENTAFVQDLASRGFVVVAIGYDNPACASAPGSAHDAATPDIDFSSRAAFERTLVVAHRRIDTVADAASRIVDALESLDRADPDGRFRGRLDLNRIAVVGYSFGGAIAMQLCWVDRRVKAAVNIDGWMFDAAPGGIEQPYMFISDDGPQPTVADLTSPKPSRQYQAVMDEDTDRRISTEFARHGGMEIVVRDSDHLDFSDIAFVSRRALLWRRRPDGSAIRTAVDYAAAFFTQALSGEDSSLFSRPPPRVQLRTWDRPRQEERVK